MRHSVYKVIAHIAVPVGGYVRCARGTSTSPPALPRRLYCAASTEHAITFHCIVPARQSACQRPDYLTGGRMSMFPVLSFLYWRSVP